MALPLTSPDDREGEPVQEIDSVGYARLPGHDHLLDSSESNSFDGGDSRSDELVAPDNGNGGHPDLNHGHSAHVYRNNVSTLNNESVLRLHGMEIYVYGQLAGLQLSDSASHLQERPNNEGNLNDRDDDIDEIQRQREEDIAVLRAKEEDYIRRSAPLPLEQCEAIKSAMQSITLNGFRPEWADKVPEEQWVERLKQR